jgi:hypothetical protein
MISIKLRKNIPFAFIALFAFASCKKNGSPTVIHPTVSPSNPFINTGPGVYVVGSEVTSNGFIVATFWKNGVAVKLTDSASNSEAENILVNGQDIYISGITTSPGNVNPVATYWKNGVATKIATGLPSIFQSAMALNDTDVYLAGYTEASNAYQKATYWKNGLATLLSDNSNGSVADAITINGNDVYVSGFSAAPYYYPAATYWKNGIPTKLTDSSAWAEATAITVNGPDVYLAGYVKPVYYSVGGGLGNPVATYWKNGVAKKLGDTTIYSEAFSIMLNGADIYIAGITMSKGVSAPVYWKNGLTTTLSTVNLTTFATNPGTAIVVIGSDVYVTAGYSGYWKNGTAVQLGKNSIALGLAIVSN